MVPKLEITQKVQAEDNNKGEFCRGKKETFHGFTVLLKRQFCNCIMPFKTSTIQLNSPLDTTFFTLQTHYTHLACKQPKGTLQLPLFMHMEVPLKRRLMCKCLQFLHHITHTDINPEYAIPGSSPDRDPWRHSSTQKVTTVNRYTTLAVPCNRSDFNGSLQH